MRADLHLHSVYSDGSQTPLEIAARAAAAGVEAIAITDHDGMGSTAEKKQAAKAFGLYYVIGLEFSAYDRDTEVHILGYGLDEKSENFDKTMQNLSQNCLKRTKIMLNRLKEFYQIDIALSEVKHTSTESVGSMHIARALVDKGYAKSVKDAFDRFIGYGQRAYCESLRPTPFDAIDIILSFGGVPVLAHPGKLRLSRAEGERFIKALVAHGLCGIEACYSTHTEEQTRYYNSLAAKYSLIVTGGSDYHGTGRSEEVGFPVFNMSQNLAERLKAVK